MSQNPGLQIFASLVFVAAGCAGTTTGGSGPPIHEDGGAHVDLRMGGNENPDLTTQSGNPDFTSTIMTIDASAPPADATAILDFVVAGKGPGENCVMNSECASNLCQAVVPGGLNVCVIVCQSATDCASYPNLFCEAIKAGSPIGYCIPRSPAHCASCSMDAECGSLAERCVAGPGDPAPACHIDCALGGAAACPPDYVCTSVTDGTAMRTLCAPKPIASVPVACLDALGGFCDRVSSPATCVRANTSGLCTGSRACLSSKRYDKCSAMAPAFKMSCSTLDPAGCQEKFAPGIATTVQNCGMCGTVCAAGQGCCNGVCTALGTASNCNACGNVCASGSACCSGNCTQLGTASNCNGCGNACGAGTACCGGNCGTVTTVNSCGTCGNVCPGQGAANDDVQCTNGTCGMTCRGDSYDVNGNAADGCEKTHTASSGHDKSTAQRRSNTDCKDSDSSETFTGTILSDTRVHQNPTLQNFSSATGSAPDWWVRNSSGNCGTLCFCTDDFNITFTTTGGGGTPCYQLTFVTNNNSWKTSVITGNDSTSISSGSGSYSDGTDVYFEIQKTCSMNVDEAVNYSVSYHL